MSKVAEVQAKYAEELAKAEHEDKVLASLLAFDGIPKPSVFVGGCYGTIGWLTFKADHYDVTYKGAQPMTRDTLRALLAQFSPAPMVHVKDGCTSFRPDTQDWKGEVCECHGVLIDINPNWYADKVVFRWYTTINGELWQVQAEYPRHKCSAVGEMHLNARRDNRTGAIVEVIECNLYPTDPNAMVIRWGKGSETVFNHFTLWWDTDSGKAVDFPAYVSEA